MYQDSEVL